MTSRAPSRVAAIVAKLSTWASSGRTQATGTPERETIADIFAPVRELKSVSSFRSASTATGTRLPPNRRAMRHTLFSCCSGKLFPLKRLPVVQDAVVPVLLRGPFQPAEDRELVSALLALVVLVEVPAGDVESVPLDRDRAASWTIRVLERMARDVPDVDVLQAFLLRDGAVLLERLDGCPRELHHLVVRVEPQEVDRGVGAEVVVDPFRQFPGGVEVVAHLRDDQVRDLDVDLLRVSGVEERLEDRIRVRDVDVLPDEVRLAGSFEVYRDAVEELRHFGDGLRGVVTVRHEDVQQACLASHHSDVSCEFDEDGRLVVGVREALTSLLQGHADDVLWLDLNDFDLAALGDVCVLAVPAKPVTARRCNAEDLRSGTVVCHGFLFDRVHVARDHPAVHVQPELALVHAANPAQADLAFADLAIAGARRAHDLVRALDRLPELGDLPRRLARRFPDIEDFRFRNHVLRYTGPIGLKHFAL